MSEPDDVPQRVSSMFRKLERMTKESPERNKARQSVQAARPVDINGQAPRAAKAERRADRVIRHDLQDGHMEISAGAYGMASARDFDIVLMAMAEITESANHWRQGKGPKPGPDFQAHVSDVLKFCRYGQGGEDIELITQALRRLSSTHVVFERSGQVKTKRYMTWEGENLIAKMKVVENVGTGDIEKIEYTLADWLYREIIEGKTPRVANIQRVLPRGIHSHEE